MCACVCGDVCNKCGWAHPAVVAELIQTTGDVLTRIPVTLLIPQKGLFAFPGTGWVVEAEIFGDRSAAEQDVLKHVVGTHRKIFELSFQPVDDLGVDPDQDQLKGVSIFAPNHLARDGGRVGDLTPLGLKCEGKLTDASSEAVVHEARGDEAPDCPQVFFERVLELHDRRDQVGAAVLVAWNKHKQRIQLL